MTMRWRGVRTLIGLGILLVAAISGHAQSAAGGVISGTVVAAGASQAALARVLVTISSPALKASRTVITDDQGRFTFGELPPGRFTVVATRPPYVKTAFGAKRPGRPGVPIELAAGQRVNDATIALARGAAITGIVRHPGGEPAPGVQVVASPLDGSPDLTVVPIVTDDRGVYRVFGLSPGRYVVRATVTDRAADIISPRTDAEMDEILSRLQRRSPQGNVAGSTTPGTVPTTVDPNKRARTYSYAPIFYPGTPDPDQAETVTLNDGEERAGMDFSLQLVHTSIIEGRVSMPGSAPPSNTQLTLTRMVQGGRVADPLTTIASARLDSAGAFRFASVLPGKYRVIARAVVTSDAAPASRTVIGIHWAAADVAVVDDDMLTVTLTMQPGLKLSGKVLFDGDAAPLDPTKILMKVTDVAGMSNSLPMGVTRADGTFEIGGILPGAFAVTATVPDGAWWLRSVMIDGRDALDFPLEINARDITGAVATFASQRTELSGSLQLAPNVPATDYFVVVFAEDKSFWRPASRRVKFTRPSTDGRFSLRDLPAGDYLIAALTDMDASDLNDPAFIERLVPAAAKVHIGEGEKKVQDLRIGR